MDGSFTGICSNGTSESLPFGIIGGCALGHASLVPQTVIGLNAVKPQTTTRHNQIRTLPLIRQYFGITEKYGSLTDQEIESLRDIREDPSMLTVSENEMRELIGDRMDVFERPV